MVPKNMTHVLQPLDLTATSSLKKIEKRAFNKYFSPSIIEAVKEDLTRDVTATRLELRVSVLKLLHAHIMKEEDRFF